MRVALLFWSACAAVLQDGLSDHPPPPRDVRCSDAESAGVLSVSAKVDPSRVDAVSFMVARADDPQRWPFLHYTALVNDSSSNLVQASLPNLQVGVSYLVMARSHERGQTTGWYLKWSNVTHLTSPCTVSATVAMHTGISSSVKAISTKTRWIEVYRHNGNNYWSTADPNNNITLPDFLDSHDAADLDAMFSTIFSAVYKTDELNGSFTRYCVEIADVDLPNITTVTDRTDAPEKGGYPVTSHFADYVSCASGNCFCMAYGDRKFRQPAKTLKALCPKCYPHGLDGCMCQCPNSSLDASLKYVGMIPTSTKEVKGDVQILGKWYSLPSGGSCALGAGVGDNGCTWRVAPLSYSISLATAFDHGIFKKPNRWMPYLGGQGNPELASKYFEGLMAQPCGQGNASPIESIMI